MKIFLSLACGLVFSLTCHSQNQEAHYKLDFSKQAQNLLHVKAELDLTQSKNRFFMLTHGSKTNPQGEAKFLKNLTARNEKKQTVNIKDLGEETWEIQSALPGKYTLEYDIVLEHDSENWDHCGGIDEVAYRVPEGLFFTGYSLFMAPDIPSLGDVKNVTVDFTLPKNWKASTPWIKNKKENQFTVNQDLRFLLNNCIFVGNHHEKEIKIGDFELLFAMGNSMKLHEDQFIELMQPIINATTDVFKGAPKKKYLIVVNENNRMTDGSAFRTSFSQIIKGKVNKNSRTNWGHIMTHETIHLWNGHTIIPKEQEEWFKEGFTDYLTNILLTRTKLIDEATFIKRFENVITKYNFSRDYLQNKLSIREAGFKKDQNRYLVYGGGEVIALGLDIEIRKASNNEKSLDDLFATLYDEFGKPNKPYELNDIIRITSKLTNKNMQWFFDDYVTGTKPIPIVSYLADMGLQLDGYLEEVYITNVENPTSEQLQFKKGILGL